MTPTPHPWVKHKTVAALVKKECSSYRPSRGSPPHYCCDLNRPCVLLAGEGSDRECPRCGRPLPKRRRLCEECPAHARVSETGARTRRLVTLTPHATRTPLWGAGSPRLPRDPPGACQRSTG